MRTRRTTRQGCPLFLSFCYLYSSHALLKCYSATHAHDRMGSSPLLLFFSSSLLLFFSSSLLLFFSFHAHLEFLEVAFTGEHLIHQRRVGIHIPFLGEAGRRLLLLVIQHLRRAVHGGHTAGDLMVVVGAVGCADSVPLLVPEPSLEKRGGRREARRKAGETSIAGNTGESASISPPPLSSLSLSLSPPSTSLSLAPSLSPALQTERHGSGSPALPSVRSSVPVR